ncbi:MAG TPA: molybdopterin molybdotransferase MoeA [Pseudolysinimonas sp.]|nr:molybdopterin molybdotransferase MoeA [Pseudolysinimonas sp.]
MTSADWRTARDRAGSAAALQAETVSLSAAFVRTLATDVAALQPIPHYASSAMDGWAISGGGPWTLVGATGASLEAGQAQLIVTGGAIPSGTTAILRQEDGTEAHGLLTASVMPPLGRHIRPAGEEAEAGTVLIHEGQLLNPAHLAVIAACGLDEVSVIRRPRIALLLTGDEVVESGLPNAGQVRDSFGPQLPALLGLFGGVTVSSRRLPDNLNASTTALATTGDADVVVTTGGTGHSSVDYLRRALEANAAEIVVEGVRMRPGGPSMLARLPDGRYVVGLPGNPLAAMMGAFTLLGPLLAALGGQALPQLGEITTAHEFAGRPGSTRLVTFRVAADGRAEDAGWHGAGMMRGLAEAAGVVIVPPDGLREGEIAETIPLPWAH